MYLMTMVLNVIIFNMFFYYITIIMLTSTPWSFFILKNKNKVFFSFSKGVTTPFKPIYKHHGSQQGFFFSFFFEGATTFIKSD